MGTHRVRERQRRAEQARQAARHRRRNRRRLGVAATLAVLAVLVAAGLVVAAAARSGPGRAPTAAAAVAGLQTGPAPWGADTTDLAARLRAIGLPPLSAAEGTAVHIHQHLDIYVDGQPIPVPALIGIDPTAGFAPLHVHDTSGVIHLESPTVRGYTLGQFFAVWGVRLTPSCLGGYCASGDRRLRVYVDGASPPPTGSPRVCSAPPFSAPPFSSSGPLAGPPARPCRAARTRRATGPARPGACGAAGPGRARRRSRP